MSRKDASVVFILKSLAVEVISWEGGLDDKTLQAIREAYKGEEIENIKEISILLDKIQKMKNNMKRWNKKVDSESDVISTSTSNSLIEIEIETNSAQRTWKPKTSTTIQEENNNISNSLGKKLILDEMKTWIEEVNENSNSADKFVYSS